MAMRKPPEASNFIADIEEKMYIKEYRIKELLASGAYVCTLWGTNGKLVDCSVGALEFFSVMSKEDFHKNYADLCPIYQPSGLLSDVEMKIKIRYAFEHGKTCFEWLFKQQNGRHIDSVITLIPADYMNQKMVCALIKRKYLNLDIEDIKHAKSLETTGHINIMLDTAPIACYLFNRELKIIDCNRHAVDLYEMEFKGEMLRSNMGITAPLRQPNGELSTEYSDRMITKAFETGGAETTWTLKTKSGREISVWAAGIRIRFGKQDAVIVYLRETTDNFTLAKMDALKKNEERRLQMVIDSMPVVCIFCDADLRIIFCNPAVISFFGVESQDDFAEDTRVFWPEFQKDGQTSIAVRDKYHKQCLETGWARFEWTYLTLDKTEIPCEVTLVRAAHEDEVNIVVFIRDLSDYYRSIEKSKMAEERLRTLLDSSPLSMFVIDENINCVEVNEMAVSVYETGSKEGFKQNLMTLFPNFQADGRSSMEVIYDSTANVLKYGQAEIEWMSQTMSGILIPTKAIFTNVLIDSKIMMLVYLLDLRGQIRLKEAEESLTLRLQAMIDASPIACGVINRELRFIDVNENVKKLFDLRCKEDLIEMFDELSPEYQPDGRLSSEKMREKMLLAFDTGKVTTEWMFQALDKAAVPCEVTIERISLQGKEVAIFFMKDLRELRSLLTMREHLEGLAFTDALTNIHNRRYFMEIAEARLADSILNNTSFFIIMMDLDYFKGVNDKHGHLVGDEVLKITAERIKRGLSHDTVLARFGGEEFIFALTDVTADDAVKVAERIRHLIGSSVIKVGKHSINLTITVGVAYKTSGLTELSKIIESADRMMYKAKKAGRNRVFCYGD